MAIVTQVEKDIYDVHEFSQALPHISATILFENNSPRIIGRTGYFQDEIWDKMAIAAVQFALISGTLQQEDSSC